MRYIILALCLLVAGCSQHKFNPRVQTHNVPVQFVGKVKLDTVSIRLLVLKHCPDDIANTDSNQAVQAANLAASKGLTIKEIGNYHIDKEGKTATAAKLVWGKSLGDLDGLKKFINEQMKVDAVPGDTLVIYTIGHGSGSGSLMRLGQREPLMRILAECAEENNQETFWWQLSCHAAAKLPPISTLTPRQQELFAMTASSPGDELSYFCTQGEQMQKVFSAMAEHNKDIDPNQDEVITAKELTDFMIKSFGEKRGKLVFARSDDEPIFGLLTGIVNQIPIRDRDGRVFPPNYIPVPR